MKRLTLILGLFGIMAGPGLYAQSLDMRANIPFEFRIGQNVMPPGTYVIQQKDGFVALRQEGGQNAAIVLTHGAYLGSHTANAGLQFNQYGDTRFLSKLWTDSGYTRELGHSSAEKTVSARVRAVEGVVVALHGK
jgi:hypothetical protein